MRGNGCELALGRKSPRCHVNTPLLDKVWPLGFPNNLPSFICIYQCKLLWGGGGVGEV